MSKSKEFWDKSADNYDKTEERFEFIHRRARDLTKKHFNDTDVVLDYGCGTGTNACEFASLVKKICAIDISTRMIEIANDKATSADVQNVDFVEADIFDESFKKESFDVIMAFNMLHTVPNPKKVVLRTLELLKYGGTFISVTPCLGGKLSFVVSLQIFLVRVLLKLGVIPIPIRRLRSSDLDDLVANKSLQLIETEEIFKGASSYFVVAKKIFPPERHSVS